MNTNYTYYYYHKVLVCVCVFVEVVLLAPQLTADDANNTSIINYRDFRSIRTLSPGMRVYLAI